MRTSPLLVILFLPIVTAVEGDTNSSCQGYVVQAERYGAPPYPDYFAAGTEYSRAAECFSLQNQTSIASNYYLLAADRYVTAADTLAGGGDFRLRGRSFESAGDAYLHLDDRAKALDLYYKAQREFSGPELGAELASVNAKIASLTSARQSGSTSWFVGLGVLVVFFVLIVFFSVRKRSTPVEKDLLDESTGRRATTLPAAVEKVTSSTISSLVQKSARERAAEKLRQKYSPKR
ncbi:hypothetical protein HYS54_00395 [Candidatus Micrarchaeota archaeon]|nr:hypothetical protein [Candidatus Micrarchaeota archaeon]